MADILAQVILGGGSVVIMGLLFKYADILSDGNVGGDDDTTS
jgi:hypothetical protein